MTRLVATASLLSLTALLALAPSVARAQDVPFPPPQPEGPMPPPAGPEAPSPGPGPDGESPMRPPPYDGIMPNEPVPPPAPAKLHLRKGPFGGVALGLGGLSLDCNGCVDFDGFGFGLDGGWALSDKWAVVLEIAFSGGLDPRDSDRGGQAFSFGAAGRFWAHERFWVQAGLSTVAYTLVTAGQSAPVEEAQGGGLALAIGADLWRSRSRHIVIDLRVRVGFYGVSSDGQLGADFGGEAGLRQTNVLVQASWY